MRVVDLRILVFIRRAATWFIPGGRGSCRTKTKLGRSLALPFKSQAGNFKSAARLIALYAAFNCFFSFAEEAPSDSKSESYQKLFQKLVVGSAAEQAKAEQELLAIGPDVLTQIPILPSSAPLEQRKTVDRLRSVLQSKVIDSFARPTVVNLQGNFIGADALIEIMEQTGNTLVMDKVPGDDIQVDFESTPFWEALDRVLDDLRLEVDPYGDTPGLRITPVTNVQAGRTNSRVNRSSYAGVFRFEPTQISATRSLERIGLNSLDIDLQVAWEPRLKPVYCRFPMQSVSAECDNGEILQATSPDASPEYSPSGSHAIEASLQFIAPSRDAKSIKRIQGTLEAMIPGGSVSVEFDELAKVGAKTQVVGKLNVVLEQVELREDILEANLLVSVNDAGESMDSFRGWIMNNDCFITTPDDERIRFAGFQTYKMTGTEVGMTYFFDLSSKGSFQVGGSIDGYQLVYNAPGGVVSTKVDFVLTDIPLP